MKTRVGVLRGGLGTEYDVSLNTGGSVIGAIPKDKYDVFDVLITKDGEWHVNGLPFMKSKLADRFDVVFNALHGEYGEDGKVQRELDNFNVPYTGSKTFASALAMNKAISKHYFKLGGLLTPEYVVIKNTDDLRLSIAIAFERLSSPFIIKPLSAGSSVGVSIATELDDLQDQVIKLLREYKAVLIEEQIKGREVTCGVIDSMESSDPYPLSVIEIAIPDGTGFFCYEDKYGGTVKEICPANLLQSTAKKIQENAVRAHKALGMRHYSRSDFILSEHGLYVLETNSLPGLTEQSLLPKSLKVDGLELPEFLDYVLTLALMGK